MALIPVVTGVFQSTIAARATAKQLPLTGTPNNIFPFAPMWIVPGGGVIPNPTEPLPRPDPYGMVPAQTGQDDPKYQRGGLYTLRGPSNWSSSHNALAAAQEDMCLNDATVAQHQYRKDSDYTNPDRGFIWDTKSAKDIKDAIQGNAVPQDGHSINIGNNVITNCDFCLVPGMRETVVKSIRDRSFSDSNPVAPYYQDYVAGGGLTGNSRRIVVVPMVTGICGGSITCPTNPDTDGPTFGSNTVIGFASFFLMTDEYYAENNANATKPICAEYIGPWVPNSMGGGAGGGSGTTGGSVLMLVD